MTRFADSFWNPEFCNFTGFEVLCKRMKDGRQTTKEYLDFLKARVQAQETYGKSLVKLAKSAGGKEEIGTLRQSWDMMRTQTEGIGLAHIHMAGAITEELNRMVEFMETQKEQRRKLEESVRKNQSNVKALYKKTAEYKKSYEARCREAELANQALSHENSKPNAAVKDLERLKQKQTKASSTAEQADNAYRSAVDSLEQARVMWEQETESACENFQHIEEERISSLRNSMWTVANMGSETCVKEDELNEEIRTSLEKCDVEKDIQLFIRQKQTGSERPASIEYENYFGGLSERNGNPQQPAVKTSKQLISSPIIAVVDNAIRPLPKANDSPTLSTTNYSELDFEDSMENDLYDRIPDTSPSKEDNRLKLRVLYDFEGRNDEELTMKENDVVFLVHKENEDWWQVETKDKLKGYYPAAYMETV